MPSPGKLDPYNKQGGKAFGHLKKEQSNALSEINKEFLEDDNLKDIEELPEKLETYKEQFIEYDQDHSGDIDIMELKMAMEKIGQAKTHLELKKMIAEVDTTDSGTITYREFINMMLGTKTSVLKLILLFEEKAKAKKIPTTIPPKRDISSLP
ncbi:hypothetical protein ScPMuIL_012459 [Solemya velum]